MHAPEDISYIARLNDEASLSYFRNPAPLGEMWGWMRFSSKHPEWARDGLNETAMAMSAFEAPAARYVLQPKIFGFLGRLGLGSAIVSEPDKAKSSSAIALFHRPAGEAAFDSGRLFYRFWLEITAAGFFSCPMAALSDNAGTATVLKKTFGIPEGRLLAMVLRVGAVSPPPSITQQIVCLGINHFRVSSAFPTVRAAEPLHTWRAYETQIDDAKTRSNL